MKIRINAIGADPETGEFLDELVNTIGGQIRADAPILMVCTALASRPHRARIATHIAPRIGIAVAAGNWSGAAATLVFASAAALVVPPPAHLV